MGAGDGAVLQPSLEICRHWSRSQKPPVTLETFPGVVHETILQDSAAVTAVIRSVVSLHAPTDRQ